MMYGSVAAKEVTEILHALFREVVVSRRCKKTKGRNWVHQEVQ